MAPKKRDRRFPVALPIVKEVRLALWAHTRGVSKTRMAEAILIDRVSNACNWDEVCRDIRQEAAILGVEPEEVIRSVLKEDGFDADIDVDGADWTKLLDGQDVEVTEDEA